MFGKSCIIRGECSCSLTRPCLGDDGTVSGKEEEEKEEKQNVISLLLKYGANINVPDVYGTLTPLHGAAQNGNIHALYILLQNSNLDLEVFHLLTKKV